jgi:pimeloyl-ACP methyl ester carboxylesterase
MLTLILLPGMHGTGVLFEPFLQSLGGGQKVQVVEYPRQESLQYPELQSVLKSVLPVDEPFVLLAESFSGPVAFEYAASAGSQLKGVIFCCTFACNPRAEMRWARRLLDFVPFGSLPTFALNHFLLGRFATRPLRTAIADAISEVPPKVLRARAKAVLEVDTSAKVPLIQVPCLYLRASHDRVVPVSASKHVERLMPTLRTIVIPGPHCLLQATPDQAALAVKAFLQELEESLFPPPVSRTMQDPT